MGKGKFKRGRKSDRGFDDGGGWKRPKQHRPSRRNDDQDAIEESVRQDDDSFGGW